jgi:hypothetical protein
MKEEPTMNTICLDCPDRELCDANKSDRIYCLRLYLLKKEEEKEGQ